MKKTVKELQFKVIIEQDEDGWYVASVPELEGCYTQGKTVDQARQRIKEVIQLVLESDKQAAREKIARPLAMPRFLGVEDIFIPYAQA